MPLPFAGLWSYRHFILTSIRGELAARYARSRLGAAWFILQPLIQSAIFALVLSELLAARMPGVTGKAGYAVYLMAGQALWQLFFEVTTRSTGVFIEFGSVMKKIAFPRLALPVIVGGSALLNHVLLLAAIVIVFAVLGVFPQPAWIALPLASAIALMLAFGLGLIVGVLNVFARDFGQVVGIGLQFWFWVTPIVYPASVVPAALRPLVEWNPMTPLVRVYQDAMLLGQWPDLSTLLWPLGLALVLMVVAFALFRRAGPELVDAL